MKTLLTLISIVIIFIAFSASTTNVPCKVESVIFVDKLSDFDQTRLVLLEFQKLDGIYEVDASIESNTIYILYDQNKITYKVIDNVFKKWGIGGYKMMNSSIAI